MADCGAAEGRKVSDVIRYTYIELSRELPPEFNAAAPVWVHATDYDALAAEFAEYRSVDAMDRKVAQERIAELEARNRLLEEMGVECAQDWQKIEKQVARIAVLESRVERLEAELASEKENSRRGWELFEKYRKKYAELRYPNMTGEVHAATAPKEPM